MESEAYNLEGNNMWFKQGKFPINLHGEAEGELMDGNGIKVTTLMDTGCSKPILNKKFYDKHPYLHQFPHYPLQAIGVVVANDGVIKVNEAIQFMVKFHGHVFEFIAYLADMSETFDLVIGQRVCMNQKHQLISTTWPSHFLKDLYLSMQLTTLA